MGIFQLHFLGTHAASSEVRLHGDVLRLHDGQKL